jgi:hypothetical protein
VYLSNTDRLRLGLTTYGSFVPDDVVAAAEKRLEQATACGEAVLAQVSGRRRARAGAGRFRADDPTTPEVNEAFEAE